MTVEQEISEAILNWGRPPSTPAAAAANAMKVWHQHFRGHDCRSGCSVATSLWAQWEHEIKLFYIWRGWA